MDAERITQTLERLSVSEGIKGREYGMISLVDISFIIGIVATIVCVLSFRTSYKKHTIISGTILIIVLSILVAHKYLGLSLFSTRVLPVLDDRAGKATMFLYDLAPSFLAVYIPTAIYKIIRDTKIKNKALGATK